MPLLSLGLWPTCALVAAAAAVVTVLGVPHVIRLARRLHVVDRAAVTPDAPAEASATPLWGGLAVGLGIWVPIGLVFLLLGGELGDQIRRDWRDFVGVGAAGFAMLALGAWDDVKRLRARTKLVIELPVAIGFALAVTSFARLSLPGAETEIMLGAAAVPLTVLWIIGVTNAVNLTDGVDGLATGVIAIAAITTGVLAALGRSPFLAVLMFSVAGACLGFLRYNFAPARIFLGDTGSLLLGMTLAAASVIAESKTQLAGSLLVACVILGYPIIDTLLAIARRRLAGRSIMSGDREHVHHRLLARGLDHRATALVIYVFCAVLGGLGVALMLENRAAIWVGTSFLGGMIVVGVWVLRPDRRSG